MMKEFSEELSKRMFIIQNLHFLMFIFDVFLYVSKCLKNKNLIFLRKK